MFKIWLFSSIGLRWAPKGLLDRFCADFGKDLGGFGKDLGRFWDSFLVAQGIAVCKHGKDGAIQD